MYVHSVIHQHSTYPAAISALCNCTHTSWQVTPAMYYLQDPMQADEGRGLEQGESALLRSKCLMMGHILRYRLGNFFIGQI